MRERHFLTAVAIILALLVMSAIIKDCKAPPPSLVSGAPYVLIGEQGFEAGVKRSVAVVGSLTGRVRSVNDDVIQVTYSAPGAGRTIDRISYGVYFLGAEESGMHGRLIDTMTGVDMGSSSPSQGVPVKDQKHGLVFQFDPRWQLQLGGQALMKLRLDTTSLPRAGSGGTRLEVRDSSSGELLARLVYD